MLNVIFSLSTLWWLILLLYIPACFGLIIIVLLQKGKGQGLAGAFGMGGGMDTIFGPRSSKSLPQKITYASAAIFMTLALVMSILSGKVGRPAAPELVADSTDASLEALFDPSAEPQEALSIPVDTPVESSAEETIEVPAVTPESDVVGEDAAETEADDSEAAAPAVEEAPVPESPDAGAEESAAVETPVAPVVEEAPEPASDTDSPTE